MIELLVVVAIIGILAAMLLPVLGRARESARRSACVSNLRQCGIGLTMYADDFNGAIPTHYPYTHSTGYYPYDYVKFHAALNGVYPQWSLIPAIAPYLADLRVWACPSAGAPPIDDPRNSSSHRYGMMIYFPGPTELEFDGMGTRIRVSNRVSELGDRDWVVMQDRVDYSNFWMTWRSNHAAGDVYFENAATNPSNAYRRGEPAGGNLMFIDGHVTWYQFKQLRDADADADAQMTIFPR